MNEFIEKHEIAITIILSTIFLSTAIYLAEVPRNPTGHTTVTTGSTTYEQTKSHLIARQASILPLPDAIKPRCDTLIRGTYNHKPVYEKYFPAHAGIIDTDLQDHVKNYTREDLTFLYTPINKEACGVEFYEQN